MQRLISNGHLYSCAAGTWSDITGAGGGSIASTTNLLKGNGSGSAVDSSNQVPSKPAFGDNSLLISSTSFVQQAIAALNPLTSADAATVTVLPFTPTYDNGTAGVGATITAGSNGVLVIDGYTVLLNDRLLIKNQASTFQNGLYDVTTLGTVSVPYVLTRSTDFNTAANMNNTQSVPVINGTANAGTLWLQTATIVTIGTDPVTFAQIGAAAQGPQNVKSVNGVSYPASPGLNTVPVVTSTAKGGSITYEKVPLVAIADFPNLIYAPAANCVNATAGSAWSTGATPAPLCRGGTNNADGLLSPWGATDVAYFKVHIPKDANTSGSIDISIDLTSTDVTNGHTIIMQVASAFAKGDGSTTDDVAFNTAQSFSTITLNGNANRTWTATLTGITTTGIAAPGIMWLKISRTTDTATNVGVYGATVDVPRRLVVQAQ